MIFWFVGSIIAGSIFGILFCYIFRRIVPCGLTSRYWTETGQNILGLLKGDEDKFWNHYRNIIRVTFRYAGLQFLGVFLAILPLIILMMTTWPWLQSIWNQSAPLTIFPNEAGKIIVQKSSSSSDPQKKVSGLASEVNPTQTLVLREGYKHYLDDALANYVFYPTGSLTGTVMEMFGFKAIPVDPSMLDKHDIVIVRAHHEDLNPLWPYLSDPEFLFFLSFSIISIVLMLRSKDVHVPSSSEGYHTGLIDNILTRIATRYAGTMRSFGEWENRIMAGQIDRVEVKKPIFITGLARAGTTILLETLAKADGIATHRYRDFPFIMTPIFWNRFISLFATKQVPVERPHKDSIKITRESPDAFEEPIWQHFFPFLHDPTVLHELTRETSNRIFEKFYLEHIKKIMIIRKGSRYLSKGNYNLTRIDYIGRIFADARFLIPIRHPLYHIESLVRQHLLFQDYAAQNPQVTEYLKAVGHYEFGPQRMPICLTHKGCNQVIKMWENGDGHLGYAIQWAEIYRFVSELHKREPDIANRLLVIRYEDLCSDPLAEIQKVLNFVELGRNDSIVEAAQKIRSPSRPLNLTSDQIKSCWKTVEDVATMYGYSLDLAETSTFSHTTLLVK
jgi:hypothetical protein